MLSILNEIKYVPANPTTPALKRLALGIHFQGRIVVVVKRTECLVLRPCSAQRHILAHQGNDIDGVLDGGQSRFGMKGHKELLTHRLRPGPFALAPKPNKMSELPTPPLVRPRSFLAASREL